MSPKCADLGSSLSSFGDAGSIGTRRLSLAPGRLCGRAQGELDSTRFVNCPSDRSSPHRVPDTTNVSAPHTLHGVVRRINFLTAFHIDLLSYRAPSLLPSLVWCLLLHHTDLFIACSPCYTSYSPWRETKRRPWVSSKRKR